MTAGGKGWLAARSVLAIALSLGFYLLAVGLSLFLLSIPVAEALYAHRLDFKLALFCLGGGFAILFSIVPRRERFVPPGPILARDAHPRLFAALESVAKSVEQELPRDVYLVPQVNAFVAERGGFLGFGRRRYMGLGLPLMQALDLDEMSAVLAHEFGHFHGGDTLLGSYIYRTQSALVRTLMGLPNGMLRKPFLWYGTLYWRLTLAVSRHQERLADALAARVVGAGPLATGLRKIHSCSGAFGAYWQSEFAPALGLGYRLPLADGFRSFLGCARVKEAMERSLATALEKEPSAGAYDSHPPLAERLKALGESGRKDAADGPLAVTLLGDVPALENALLEAILGAAKAQGLRPLTWENVPEAVIIPGWKKAAAAEADDLEGLTVGGLPQAASRLGKNPFGDANQQLQRRASAYGAALGLVLLRQGWTLLTAVGEPVRLHRGDTAIQPFEIVARLAQGDLTGDAWRAQASELGIASLPLEKAAAAPAPDASGPGAVC